MFDLDRKWNCGLVCDVLPQKETRMFFHSFSLQIYFQNCHIIMTYNIGKGEC